MSFFNVNVIKMIAEMAFFDENDINLIKKYTLLYDFWLIALKNERRREIFW